MTRAIAGALIRALADGPKTVTALAQATGKSETTIREWLYAWEQEGIVRRCGYSPRRAPTRATMPQGRKHTIGRGLRMRAVWQWDLEM